MTAADPDEAVPVVPGRFSATVIIVVLCTGALCCALMQSLVIPIQSELGTLLDTDAASASWVVTVTLLAGAVSMPLSGRFADMYGKKRVLVVTISLLVLGSIVTAASGTLVPVIVGRALQGAAMGYIPVAISMVDEVAPRSRRAGAVAAMSAMFGVGGALGLPLAAWVAQDYSWHVLFWSSAVAGVLVLLLTVVVVPAVRDAHPARLDLVGVVGLVVGLSATLIGISKGADWGWASARTLGAVLGGLLVLLGWSAYELRHHDPLVDLRTSASRPVLFTNLAAVLVGFGLITQFIVVPQLLELPAETGYGLGQSVLHAGLWMAPSGIVMMLCAPLSSRLINSVGARITLVAGSLLLAAGYGIGLLLMSAPWQVMLAVCITSAGVGVGYAAMPTLILENVPADQAGAGIGVNALMRSVGTTTAGAVIAAILAASTTEVPGHGAVPTQSAFVVCFAIGGAGAFLGAVLASVVPRRSASRDPYGTRDELVGAAPVDGRPPS